MMALLCRVLLVAGALIVPTTLQAQAELRGQVRDQRGNAVIGVQVAIPALGRGALSDSSGAFTLSSLPSGRFLVTASRIGFETWRDSVALRDDAPARIAVVLRETVLSLERRVVQVEASHEELRPAPDVLSGVLTVGARSEVVSLRRSDVNFAEKVPRQVFARVPGVLVYDMDGAGNQTNISTRGLDPHRSWEFNVRQDGVLVNSDIYGYPASHYSPPMEAMERVELLRGTAALQYGAQFGGLLNYRTRAPDTTRAFGIEGSLTGGSFDMRNVFVGFGGRVGRVDYQAYAAMRESDGFRNASRSDYDAQFAALTFHASTNLRLRARVGRSYYLHSVPGPLTDSMFYADPRTATRTRNWFSPEIVVPALRLEWEPSSRTSVSAQVSTLTGRRGSTLFVGFATTPDTINTVSGEYAPRIVDIDDFDSRTAEVRLLHRHRLAAREATLVTGLTISRNHLHRRQQGPGSRGTDYDLNVSGAFGRDLHYRSSGLAWFAEEMIAVTPRWRLIPGLRVERGLTRMTGTLAYYDPADTPRRVRHDFPLLGIRSTFALDEGDELYGGWSQAFRPMLLKDLLPENAIERTDPAMRDARGWTTEFGHRGRRPRFGWDVGGFVMHYADRFGGVLRDDGGGPYLFKTNVGTARTVGLEVAADAVISGGARGVLRGFTSLALFDARYIAGSAVQSGSNVALRGNRVEGVPSVIVRGGLSADGALGSVSLMASYTSDSYADALNERIPPPTGARGLVPAYLVWDLTASRPITPSLRMRLAVSNLLDAQYFTKRPAFYPGPGVWPSDGRSVQLGLTLER